MCAPSQLNIVLGRIFEKKGIVIRMLLKRLSAIAVAAVMTIGMAASAITANAVSTNNIDTTRTGSITIHKYEMSDVSALTDRDTGEAIDAEDIPTGATPLAGVTFEIKKVGEISTYFSGNNLQLPTPAQADAMQAIGQTSTQTTNASGIATFSSLPLGIYLVKETAAPAQVNQRTADFVVAVPQTKPSNDAEWLYDINVYPKNETNYADFNIKKVDKDSPTTLIQGAKFIIHNDTINQDYPEITTNASGIAPIQGLPVNSTYTIRETFVPAPHVTNTVDTWTFSIDSTGQAYVTQMNDATPPVQVNVNLTDNTIEITNDKPEIHKSVVLSNISNTDRTNIETGKGIAGTATDENPTVTMLGLTEYIQMPQDKLTGWTTPNKYNGPSYTVWKIKAKIPEHIADMSTFTVTDVLPTGLTYVASVAEANGNKLFSDLAADTEITSPTVSGKSLTWAFDTADLAADAADGWDSLAGKTYDNEVDIWVVTTCDADFPLATAVGSPATLTYSDTAHTTAPASDTTRSLTSETPTVYTGGFNLTKLGENNAALSNATFAIYATENDALNDTNRIAVSDTNANGNIVFTGLSYGSASTTQAQIDASGLTGGSTTYYVAELKAAEGYNLLASPKAVTVNSTSHLAANTTTFWDTLLSILPHTGGIGIFLYGVPAVGLVGLGLFMIIKKKKKQN